MYTPKKSIKSIDPFVLEFFEQRDKNGPLSIEAMDLFNIFYDFDNNLIPADEYMFNIDVVERNFKNSVLYSDPIKRNWMEFCIGNLRGYVSINPVNLNNYIDS